MRNSNRKSKHASWRIQKFLLFARRSKFLWRKALWNKNNSTELVKEWVKIWYFTSKFEKVSATNTVHHAAMVLVSSSQAKIRKTRNASEIFATTCSVFILSRAPSLLTRGSVLREKRSQKIVKTYHCFATWRFRKRVWAHWIFTRLHVAPIINDFEQSRRLSAPGNRRRLLWLDDLGLTRWAIVVSGAQAAFDRKVHYLWEW